MRDAQTASWDNDADYQEALQFAQSFEPDDTVDYQWTIEYAREYYERILESFQRIDNKANAMLTYLSGFTGIAALMFAYQAASEPILGALALPMLIAAIVAVWKLTRAISPSSGAIPPTVYAAVKCAEIYGRNAEALFATQYGAAAAALVVVAEMKSKHVSAGMKWFVVAIILTALPVLGAAIVGGLSH